MSKRLTTTAVVAGLLLLVVATLLLTLNPSVNVTVPDYGDTQSAGKVGCSIAPYDAGLNGNDDPPGGEHTAAYSEEVAADCYAANTMRFRAAVATAVVGTALLALAIVLGWRGRQRGRQRDRLSPQA